MRIHSITIVGHKDQKIRLERKVVPGVGIRVEVSLPDQLNVAAGVFSDDRDQIYSHIVPLIYGVDKRRAPRDGKNWPDCTNSMANDVIDEVQRLFWPEM